MNKMSGGGANMMFGMGKSNAKIYVPSEEGIRFSDVAGEDEAKEKPSNHLRVGLMACVVVILLVVVGVMLLHLHNTNKPQNEIPISEMETEEDDVVFSGDFSVDW